MRRSQVLESNRAAIRNIAARHHVHGVRVFGSVLRGTDTDASDLDAVIRNIEVIGEAAQSIRRRYPEYAAQYPEISWGGVYGMRNAIAHGYFAVDLDVVWKTVCKDLPALAEQVRALRITLQKDPSTGD